MLHILRGRAGYASDIISTKSISGGAGTNSPSSRMISSARSRQIWFALYNAVLLGVCLAIPSTIADAKIPFHKIVIGGGLTDLPPISLRAEATGDHKITLYWSSVDGAKSYAIYRSTKTGGPYTKIKTAAAFSFPSHSTSFCKYIDSGLKKSVEYFYYVLGSKNERSVEWSATPGLHVIPWDTDDAKLILAAAAKDFSAIQGEPVISPDSPDLEVISPDRVTYHNTFKGSVATAVGIPEHAPVKTGTFNASTKDDAAVWQVWSKTNDGGDYARATEWFPSPSDNYIVVVTGKKAIPILGLETNLCLLSKRSGTNRPLTEDGLGYETIRWNTDEKQIAYLSQEGHYSKFDQQPSDADIPWTVYAQNIINGKRIRLFKENALPPEKGVRPLLEWIPQRSQLLYSSARPRGLYLLGVDGTKPKRLATTSPDGIVTTAGLAYWHEDSKRRIQIAHLPARTTDWAQAKMWKQITPFVTFSFPSNPVCETFSRTGQLAVLVPLIDGNTWPRTSQLVVIDPLTRQARSLGIVPAEWCGNLSWSADGSRLILAQSNAQDEEKQASVDIRSTPLQSFGTLNWKSRALAALHPILPDAPKHLPTGR